MRRGFVTVSFLASVLVLGCGAPVESTATVTSWLDSRAGGTAVNVAGSWTDREWGTTYFQQAGNRLTGKVGAYVAYGSINGYVVSLALYSGGALYYTATLQMSQEGVLAGKYFRTTRQEEGWPMVLTRAM